MPLAIVRLPYIPPMVSPEQIDEQGEFKSTGSLKKMGDKTYVAYKTFAAGGGGSITLLQDPLTGKPAILKEIKEKTQDEEKLVKREFETLKEFGKTKSKLLKTQGLKDEQYEFKLLEPDTKPLPGVIYLQEVKRESKNKLAYTMVTMDGSVVNDVVMGGVKYTSPLTSEALAEPIQQNKLKNEILDVITNNRHILREGLTNFSFVMEYEKGTDLRKFCTHKATNPPPLSNVRLIDMALQACERVQELHDKKRVHCDINPNNFMYNRSTQEVVLIDYGEAKELGWWNKIAKDTSVPETAGYVAPEVKEKHGDYFHFSPTTDSYALGKTLEFMIQSADASLKENIFMRELITRMTAEDPTKRPSLEFVTKALNLLREEQLHLDRETVAIVDVRELAAMNKEKKEQFFTALKTIDEVVLVDNDESKYPAQTTKQIQLLKRELEDQGIFVKQQVIQSPDNTSLAFIPDSFSGKEESKKVLRSFVQMTAEPPVPEMKQSGISHMVVNHNDTARYQAEIKEHLASTAIPEAIRSKLITDLIAEKERMREKYENSDSKIAANRIAILDRTISVLKTANNLTFDQACLRLESVKQQMKPVSGLKKLFGMKAEGEEKLETTLKGIKEMHEAYKKSDTKSIPKIDRADEKKFKL